MRRRPACLLLGAALLASACANFQTLVPGTPAASLARPARVWNEPDGSTTWEYPMGPSGRYTYMARVGKDGRVARVDQVLDWKTFGTLQHGMTTEQVERMLGRPYKKVRYALTGTTTWSWRFVDTVWYRCFQADFAPDGKLIATGAKDEESADVGVVMADPC